MASERFKHAIARTRIIHISRRPPLQPTPKGVVSDSLGRCLKNHVPDCYSAGSAAKPFNGDKKALLPPITDFRSTVSRPNMMNLDLQSLRIFVSAIESKSLTKAAEENALVTSGASKRIADLESRLGVDLLVRHARGVQGTPAGLSLYHHAKAILRRVEIAQDVVAEFGKAGNPKVRLAANPSSIIAYIPPITRRYLSESPTARIDLQERYSYDIPRLVAENEADVGIYHALSPAPGVTSYPFKRDRIVLVTRRDHPLARFDELFLEHANSYPFVGYFPRHTYDAFSSFAGRSLSRPLDVKIEVGNYEARCRLIQEGIGIGVIPEPNASPYLNLYNLKALKLLDEWAERQLYVCISNDRDLSDYPETKRFLDCLLAKSD